MVKPFVTAETPFHYAPDRPVAVEHVRLEVDLDFDKKAVAGKSILRLRVRADDVKTVTLDAVEMTMGAITVDGAAAVSDYDGARLVVTLPRLMRRDEVFMVTVAYSCRPRRGLYFIGPDAARPEQPRQCWTQGQDEDSRHYWPGIDAPAEKATSEVICTAPRGMFVLSNGDLKQRRDIDTKRTEWQYTLDLPHSAYLLTLVAGDFVEIRDRAPETGVEVFYYAPPGREADARRSLGHTPAMIDHFSQKTGIPYPFRRYSQIFVADFIFGGMENTTATTLTDQVLLDERAAIDHDVEALVSHELAHQWWGDLVTCREWPEAWLNEGFATYFEYVWREHARGRDEADIAFLADAEAYLGEAARYQRPIVQRQYDEPIDLFDSHTYDKGGRVMHMLRQELGDAAFFAALKIYAQTHAHGVVETRDLSRAIESTTGRNLDGFFDQWIRRAGHPELGGSYSWNDERRVATVKLEQKQAGERAFVFTARLRFEVDGHTQDDVITMRERLQSFEIACKTRPTQMVFDPGDVLLKTIDMDKPLALWLRQLEAAPLAVDRVLAARVLAGKPEPRVLEGVRAALTNDPFWAVRVAAAQALGQMGGAEARDTLLASRTQTNPRVRRAVAAALGEFRDDAQVGEALVAWASTGDVSAFAEAQVALSLGRIRSPRAVTVLTTLLDRTSYQDVIRARALEGLGETGDEAALPVVTAAYQPGASFQVRRAAINAIGRLAEGHPQTRRLGERIENALADTDFRVRMDAGIALANLGDARAIPAIDRAAARELDGRAKRRLRRAIADLTERGRPVEQARKLADEVDRLRRETIKLRDRMEKLEARSGGGPETPGKADASTRRPAPRTRRGGSPRRRKH